MSRYLLSLFVLISIANMVNAQTPTEILVEQLPSETTIDTILTNDGDISLQTTELKQVYLSLSDTSEAYQIRVHIGDTPNSYNILNQDFLFAGQVVDSSISLARVGNACNLKLGYWINRDQAYYTFSVLNANGAVIAQVGEILY